jgi:glycosyltransferase involved in cell wall biosynthesis
MPCHNDGAYLNESISSVTTQTYPNWELILINDGSTDPETNYIIDTLKIPNLTVLHTSQDGPAQARNLGIETAKGIYILPLDADDKIDPSYIAKAVSAMEKNEYLGAVYCFADLFGEKSGVWDLPRYSLDKMLLDNIVFVSALFRKSDWLTVGGFCIDFMHGMEDYDFFLSLLQLGKDIYQIPETLFYYRIKPASRTTTFTGNTQAVLDTYKMLYVRHKALYEKHMDIYCLEMRRALLKSIAELKALSENASAITPRRWLVLRYPRIADKYKRIRRKLSHRSSS